MRIKWLDRAPRHFMIAMESRRCWMWACIAVATPMAPTISVIRLTRLKNVVARFRPCVMMGCVSRKSAIRASGKAFFNSLANLLDARSGRSEAKQKSLRGAAAGQHQSGPIQTLARHHHARADIQTAEHAVRLESYLADNLKWLIAQPQRVADFQIQAQQDVIGNGDSSGRKRRSRAARPATGRSRHKTDRAWGPRLSSKPAWAVLESPPEAMVRVSVIQVSLNIASGQLIHDRAFAAQWAVRKPVAKGRRPSSVRAWLNSIPWKRAAESADSGKRSDSHRDGENHKQKFERRRARLAPSDFEGSGPGESMVPPRRSIHR